MKNKKLLSFALFAAVTGVALLPVVAHATSIVLFGIDPRDPNLQQISPLDGHSIGTPLTISIVGGTVDGGTGLATHPVTGDLYAILKIDEINSVPLTGRALVTLDPFSGVATYIGDTGDKFAGLAFDDLGTLYGVTGDGADAPEELYTINTMNAAATHFMDLGNGDDGEAIGFSPDDGLVYHASGGFGAPGVFESIDLVGKSTNFIGYTCESPPCDVGDLEDLTDEIGALVYDPTQDLFLATNGFNDFMSIMPDGTDPAVVIDLGETALDIKGLAFAEVPVPPAVWLFGSGLIGLVGLARRKKA